ncbi:MAG: hypothetical protein AAF596_04155 [Planctomycetota bacterium]
MTLLLENPVPGAVAGAVLITLAGIVYSSLRTTGSLVALAVAIALCGLAVGVEWLVETPREQAERALYGLLDDVEANDLPGVLARLAPTAGGVRADAERLMPEFEVDKANCLGSMEVSIDEASSPPRAEVSCRVFVSARHRRTAAKGGDMTDVTFSFVRIGGAWLLDDYTGGKDWRRGAAELRSSR